jgi:hypothetical protein
MPRPKPWIIFWPWLPSSAPCRPCPSFDLQSAPSTRFPHLSMFLLPSYKSSNPPMEGRQLFLHEKFRSYEKMALVFTPQLYLIQFFWWFLDKGITPHSAADFGRIRPNSGHIAGFLEFVSKLHGRECWRRRRRRSGLQGRL